MNEARNQKYLISLNQMQSSISLTRSQIRIIENISIVSMAIMCDNNTSVVIFKDSTHFLIENDCYIVCL